MGGGVDRHNEGGGHGLEIGRSRRGRGVGHLNSTFTRDIPNDTVLAKPEREEEGEKMKNRMKKEKDEMRKR